MKIKQVVSCEEWKVKLVRFSVDELKQDYVKLLKEVIGVWGNTIFYTNIENWWVELKHKISKLQNVLEAGFVSRKGKVYFRVVVDG